ncbi:Required for respiratory growth 9, mitochondrial [Gossypium arboreum]|uniref:Required for respiratory growth 9, mitochondrial n=1 Tax=Gossypium arboreum TaxID=29729 RepID=A0A0B0N5Q5_GOSAR|nr:Required for respiratory growth 9, mitochondrial [Gossypium arboreum]
MPMPCLGHGLILAHISSQCHPRHGLTLTIVIEADAMSQAWSYTSSHISVPLPCPRHGLTLTHLVANACPRHVLH